MAGRLRRMRAGACHRGRMLCKPRPSAAFHLGSVEPRERAASHPRPRLRFAPDHCGTIDPPRIIWGPGRGSARNLEMATARSSRMDRLLARLARASESASALPLLHGKRGPSRGNRRRGCTRLAGLLSGARSCKRGRRDSLPALHSRDCMRGLHALQRFRNRREIDSRSAARSESGARFQLKPNHTRNQKPNHTRNHGTS